MPRIRVEPAQLDALGARLQQVGGELLSVESRVGGALGGLDWEARQKAGVDGQVDHARSQARALAAQADEMGRYLKAKSQAFEEADRQGVSDLGQVLGAFTESQRQAMQAPYSSIRTFPRAEVDAYLQLGGSGESVGPVPVPRRPDGRRALFDIGLDTILKRLEPLNLAKDLWDVVHVGDWQRKWDQVSQEYQTMILQYGQSSPEAQAAYQVYLETIIFEMPFFGSKIEGLFWLLNATAKPVY